MTGNRPTSGVKTVDLRGVGNDISALARLAFSHAFLALDNRFSRARR